MSAAKASPPEGYTKGVLLLFHTLSGRDAQAFLGRMKVRCVVTRYEPEPEVEMGPYGKFTIRLTKPGHRPPPPDDPLDPHYYLEVNLPDRVTDAPEDARKYFCAGIERFAEQLRPEVFAWMKRQRG